MKYSVSIAEERDGPITLIVYEGDDYLEALYKAVDCRSIREWSGRWIKFKTPERDKWAKIY